MAMPSPADHETAAGKRLAYTPAMPQRARPETTTDQSPLTAQRVETVRCGLLGWFDVHARDLPWRRTRDPYAILVAEVMLQQTQVDRVIPYYERWLAQFPDVAALAAAPTADVITAWAGLGYNRRAVNLQRTARFVVDERGGQFPDTVTELLALPGVGPYTAGAIAAFAFEQDVAFIDTNMRRVLHRLAFGPDVPDQLRHDREVLLVARQLVPPGDGWRWNQALIEFGALQCTARKPACLICPLNEVCASYPAIQGALSQQPRKSRKMEPAFAGSNRYYRGRIIDALRAAPPRGLPLTVLGPAIKPDFALADLPWLDGVVAGLAKDGLVVSERAIGESIMGYVVIDGHLTLDDEATDATHSIIVRLP